MNKYFNETNQYKEPTLIRFDKPIKIKLYKLSEFLDSYKPFPCSNVYLYQRFEYGDYDNWVNAIIESTYIDASFCRVYKQSQGIFNEGETSWSPINRFWYFQENKPFWNSKLYAGYPSGTYKSKFIDEIEIEVEGVYIISWTDKEKIELEAKKEEIEQFKKLRF